MNQFTKKVIGKNNIPETDKGVSFLDLISIISNDKLGNKLLELLDKESYKDDFIKIPGAATLVSIQKKINKRYWKEDLESSLENINLYNDKKFSINFNSLEKNEYFKDLKLKKISTEPLYSASRDFFSSLLNMDKYASSLISKGHRDIVDANLNLLKTIQNTKRKYRVLHDREENLFFLRAIVSLNKYFDYNNNIAVVIGLLMLHNESKSSKIDYKLLRCEYNESFIRMFFESTQVNELENIGQVKNIIQISNDEIKREALRFTGVCTISFKDSQNQLGELFIQPQDIKSKILSIKHNQVPSTAIEELSKINNSKKVHQELYKDITKISKIKDPEQIKYLVRKKIENAKGEEVKRFKQQYLDELKNGAKNIIQLLTIFKKMELLSNEDIESSEYIRYIIYNALIEKK